jgi:hypothetical protein
LAVAALAEMAAQGLEAPCGLSFRGRRQAATGGRGVDVVFDGLGRMAEQADRSGKSLSSTF